MSHLDLTYLREQVSDDESFLKQLLQVFLDSSREDIIDLNAAVDAENHERIMRAAHKVKSSFRSLGMIHLTDQLQSLEDQGKAEAPMAEIRPLFDAFHSHFPQVETEVKAFLA